MPPWTPGWACWIHGERRLRPTVSAVVSRAGLCLVAAALGAVTVLPVLAGVSGGFVSDDVGRALSVLAMAAFGAGWILLGIGALRRGRSPLPVPAPPRS
jgi:hypothetical protein